MSFDGPVYYCDPEKNKSCPKTGCKYKPKSRYGACELTRKKHCAKLDENGQPMQFVPKEDDADRFRRESGVTL